MGGSSAAAELTVYSPAEMLGSNCSRLQGPDTDPLSVDVLRQPIVEIVTDEIVGYEALSPDAERQFVFATSYRRGLV